MVYCNPDDVRVICSMKSDEISDVHIASICGKAKADIDSGIGSMYRVPFDDAVLHPRGVPEKIRWLCAELAKCIIHSREYDDGEPNETTTTASCFRRVDEQISALINCEYGLTYPDNTIVPRIGKCPDNSPSPSSMYAPIMSNTIRDDAIFTLEDITDNEKDTCGRVVK